MSTRIVLADHLRENGYMDVRLLPSGEVAGLFSFIFTTGLVVGLDAITYRTRYCYAKKSDALSALQSWSGAGDPPGPWIKQKPEGRSGPGAKGEPS